MRVDELAALLGSAYEGNGAAEISGAAPVETAGDGQLAFVSGAKSFPLGLRSAAGCLIAPADYPRPEAQTVIRAETPRGDFALAVSKLYPPRPVEPGVHRTAVIETDVELGSGVEIGPHAFIGAGSVIGGGTRIADGCSIGRNVSIGERCVLHPRVTLYDGVELGRAVILHSGCVIGSDGFGFVMQGGRYEKFPQIGRVTIEDSVEIGANSCVDRAALGVTRIGEGSKLDNLVHVAHNCDIGRHVVIAAQTGFSGGVVVGDYAVIGGQVGIGDKARIESRAVLGSGCGVLTSKIVRAGEPVWGTPARPLREHLEHLATLARMPRVLEQLKRLAGFEKRLEQLEAAAPPQKR